jgi:hypothetical protein
MTAEEHKDDWHIFYMIVASVLALTMLCGGISVGCSKFTAWNSQNGVKQLRADTQKAFYKYCQRSLSIGRVVPECPR